MARRGPRSTGRDALWATMRRMREFSRQDLVKVTDQPFETVKDYVRGLLRAGIVEATGELQHDGFSNRSQRAVYRLVNDCGVDAPRVRRDGSLLPPLGRDRMWRSMRILKEFSPLDVAVAATLEAAPVAEEEARSYCLYLMRAGYLVEVEKGRRYRFLPSAYTGPRSPMIRRIKDVVDGNTGEVKWSGDPQEVTS